MEENDAIARLAALAQETRLRVFRLLVEHGPGGLPAGDVARQLGVPANTMSTHLAVLTRAGLIRARRDRRLVIYAADIPGLRGLLAFLLQDCCRGRPEACGPLLDAALLPACCEGTPAP